MMTGDDYVVEGLQNSNAFNFHDLVSSSSDPYHFITDWVHKIRVQIREEFIDNLEELPAGLEEQVNTFDGFFGDLYQENYNVYTGYSSFHGYMYKMFKLKDLKDKYGNDVSYIYTSGENFPITLTKNVGTIEEESFVFRPNPSIPRFTLDYFSSSDLKYIDINIYAIPNEEDME